MSGEWRSYLQFMTCHQEDASLDGLPPGLGPRGVVFGGELPQVERRGHGFGQTGTGADAVTLPLGAVGWGRTLNPPVAVNLSEETIRIIYYLNSL